MSEGLPTYLDEEKSHLARLSLTKTLCARLRMSFPQANREAQAVRRPDRVW